MTFSECFFYALVIGFCILLMWTLVLTSYSLFLGITERASMRFLRRASLALIGVAVLQMARWHWETGHLPWVPEIVLLIGLNTYFAGAICSTYQWMKRAGIKLESPEQRQRAVRSAGKQPSPSRAA